MTTSEQVDKIFPALIKAQSEMGNAKKTSANPFFKSKYADLAEIIEVSKIVLTENGLGIIQSPIGNGNNIGVTARIIHESGQWIEDTITITPTKNDPQQAGSAITYARRYQLAALFNIAQEDDDGNSATYEESHTKQLNVKNELEEKTVILEQYIKSGIVSGENTAKARKAINDKNIENIIKWNEWAKKQAVDK